MHAQRGISLTGFLVFAALVVAALLLGFKMGPPYMEFYAIQKAFRVIAAEPALRAASRGEINAAFSNRAAVDNIKVISYNDIEVVKDSQGIVLSARYSVCVPLFYNISACMDFRPTSEK